MKLFSSLALSTVPGKDVQQVQKHYSFVHDLEFRIATKYRVRRISRHLVQKEKVAKVYYYQGAKLKTF